MGIIQHGFYLLLILLAVSGCASISSSSTSTSTSNLESGNPDPESPLDHWVQNQVLPDLQQKLTTLPMFRGQPLMIVGMKDGGLAEQSNSLVKSVQRQIIHSLLATPSILLTNPGNHRSEPATDLNSLSCGLSQEADIFIGIETNKDIATGKVRVSIKAYDANEQLRFLSGLSYDFEDRLNAAYLQALKTDQEDESIKGSRRAPFNDSEPDILAASLSHQLACLLSQSAKEDIVLFPIQPADDSVFLATTTTLVAKLLADYRQITITEDAASANTLLHLSDLIIGAKQRLHLISADVADTHKRLMGGASAKAYVRYDILTQLAARPVKERTFAISLFNLLTPTTESQCASRLPWSQGERRRANGDFLQTGDCFALEASTNEAAELFLIYQNPDHQLQRLLPTQCKLFSDIESAVTGYELMRYPSIHGRVKALDLGKQRGEEGFYLIATKTPEAKAYVKNHLKQISDICDATTIVLHDQDTKVLHDQDASDSPLNTGTVTDLESWLKDAQARFYGQLLWRKTGFSH